MMKSFVVVIVAVLALGLTLGVGGHLANACPDTNTADLSTLYKFTNYDGAFDLTLFAEWHLKSGASWVVVQATETSQSNVDNLDYTPWYLQDEACEGSYPFFCTGNLIVPSQVGNVTSRLDAGTYPNHASDIEATFIDKAY